MQPAAPPPCRRRRGRGDLQQTCQKSSRARASSAAKKLSGDRHRVLTMHTATTGRFVIGGRVYIEPCQSTCLEQMFSACARAREHRGEPGVCRNCNKTSIESSRPMLGLFGKRTSHTPEAYMSNGEARGAGGMHHLPTPFRSDALNSQK